MKNNKKKTVKTVSGEIPDQINITPELNGDNIKESREHTAVFAFGRFNPISVGHEKLIHKVHQVAQDHNGQAHVVASHSEGTGKNPIPQNKKLEYLKKVAPEGVHVSGSSKEAPSFIHAAKKLHQSGAKHLVMVAGSDRVEEYKKKLSQYNGHPDHYNFKSIKVVSAGKRDPDSEGVSGISGTKMREYARTGNKDKFKKYLPKALHPHSEDIINHISATNEDTAFKMFAEGVLDYAQRRRRAQNLKRREPRIQRQKMIALRRFASDVALKRRAQHAARSLIRTKLAGTRGSNYTNLSTGDKIAIDKVIQNKQKLINAIAKRMLGKVRRKEAVRLARFRAGIRGRAVNASYEHEELNYDLFESIYNKVLNDRKQEEVLENKSVKSGIPLKTIKEVYARGLSEYSITDKKTPEQFAFDRVNSYINMGKALEMDSDLNEDAASHMRSAKAAQAAGKFKTAALHRRIAGALMRGDRAAAKYASDALKDVQENTSQLDESFVVDRPTGMGVTYTSADLGMHTKGGFAYHPSVIEEIKERNIFKDISNEEEFKEMLIKHFGEAVQKFLSK